MPLAIVHRIIKLLRSVRKRPSALVYWQERARMVEDTADIPDRDYWKYRSEDSYRELVRFVDLKPLSSYQDLNNRVSVKVGGRHG